MAQNKNDQDFDRIHYTKVMKDISNYLYDLPLIFLETKKKIDKTNSIESEFSDYIMDELFMWSTLIYSGQEKDMKLIKYYWSLTSRPIACALAAIIVYNRIAKKSFVNREFKQLLKRASKEFEELAIGVLKSASMAKTNEAQDLILRENEYFYNHTTLQLGIKAEAEEFISCLAVQELLSDIWHGKISPFVSSYRILTCVFFWPLVFIQNVFRHDIEVAKAKDKKKEILKKELLPTNKNEREELAEKQFHATDLPFRVSGEEFIGFRLFYFLDTPIIKYLHHTLMHILILIIFCYLILFDLYPLATDYQLESTNVAKPLFGISLLNILHIPFIQMSMSEVFIILYMFSLTITELREVCRVYYSREYM